MCGFDSKQQKDCWSCFHTSRALVTGKLLHSAPSAVLLVCECVCVSVCVQGMLLFYKARTLCYMDAKDKCTYASDQVHSKPACTDKNASD